MFRGHHNTSPAPFHLRQSRGHVHHQRQEWHPAFSFGVNMPNVKGKKKTLDLSMHLPSHSFSNRFEALTTPPPEDRPSGEFSAPTRYRRSRNSRGTKEAKRRRDARRSRRKLAAQMLNEQLSREIDQALNLVNFFPTPPPSVPSPTPVLPMTSFTPPMPAYFPPPAPSPPQLPRMEFPTFCVDTFPQIHPSQPLTPPSPIVLPDWCPALECFTRNGTWCDGLPRFYDLSSLPEPKELPKQEPKFDRELQLWRGDLDLKPKQSRFFPMQQKVMKPTVKLPPTACKLHMMEKGLPGTLSAPHQTSSYADVVKRGTPARMSKEEAEIVNASGFALPLTPTTESTAANFWHILTATTTEDSAESDSYLASFGPLAAERQTESDTYPPGFGPLAAERQTESCSSLATRLVEPYLAGFRSPGAEHETDSDPYLAAWVAYLEADDCAPPVSELDSNPYLGLWHGHAEAVIEATTPAELDGKELPYVHANSLTGHNNEINSSPYAVEHPSMTDSGVSFTPLPSPPIDLNDLLINMDVFEEVLSDSMVQTGHKEDNVEQLCPTPLLVMAEMKGGEPAINDSDAHFQSEQELFELPSPSTKSPTGSVIDVAAFLKLGHAKNCWCNLCDEAPTIVSTSGLVETPEMIATDALAEIDDEWMLYSVADNQSTTVQSATMQPMVMIDEEEKQTTRTRCGPAPEWDDFFPPTPKVKWQDVLAKHKDGDNAELGGDEDCDWIWDVDY